MTQAGLAFHEPLLLHGRALGISGLEIHVRMFHD